MTATPGLLERAAPVAPRPSDAPPLVSVLMIAYNVEPFIAQALDSILMQAVDFPYEVVVGEDCSTDATRRIVLDYQRRHPDRIRPILRERNLGMNENFVATLGHCRGRYIALLDGDDYWTRADKLRTQVEFLERHPDYAVSFHNTHVVYEDGSTTTHPFHVPTPTRRLSQPVPRATSTVADLVTGNFMQTCSVVFRAGLFGPIPDWFLAFPTFDWPLHILNAEHGHIRYIDEIMGAYRVHPRGIWSMNMSRYARLEDVERMIAAYRIVDDRFGRRYHAAIRKPLASLHYRAAHLLAAADRHAEARRHAMRALRLLPPRLRAQPRHIDRQAQLVGIIARSYLHRLRGRRALKRVDGPPGRQP